MVIFWCQGDVLAAGLNNDGDLTDSRRKKIIREVLDGLSVSESDQMNLRRKIAIEETMRILEEKRLRDEEKASSKIRPKKHIRWTTNGEWQNRFYYDTIENDPWEDVYFAYSQLSIENKIKFPGGNAMIFASFDARYDLDGDDDYTQDADLRLREAYFQNKADRWDFRLGRQNITWGKLDGVSILDIINPQDVSEFILFDKQQRKLPVFMAKLDYYWDNNSIEGIFIPWFKPNRVKFFDSDWAVYGHLREGIYGGGYSESTKQLIRDITIEEWDKDYSSLDDFEVAVRFSGIKPRYDYSFYYMHLYSRNPQLRENTPVGLILKAFLNDPTAQKLAALVAANPAAEDLKLNADYNRIDVVGADFETTLGSYGVRAEAALSFSPLYLRNDFSLVPKETLTLGLGVDRSWANNFYCNLQLIEDIIFDYEPLFAADQFTHQMNGTLSQDFLRGNLIPSLDFAYNISHGDSYLNPEITYKFSGGLSLSLGGYIFDGDVSTAYGRFDTNDVVYLTTEYKF